MTTTTQTSNETTGAAPAAAPLVSVIMATRNRSAALLARSLDSIRAQDMPDFEVIVVDDGSSAKTLAEQADLRAGLDSRFILDGPIFPGAPGTGPSAAYNRGIRRARGQFIAFCDDDDYWIARDYLGVGVEMLRRHDADVFLGNIQLELRDKTTPLWASKMISSQLTRGPRLNDRPEVYEVSLSNLMKVMRHCNPSQRSAGIVRRELIDRAGFFLERVSMNEDTEWAMRTADAARKILYRTDPVVNYNRSGHDSLSSQAIQYEQLVQPMLWTRHLRATCSHRSVRSCARSLEAWSLRVLAARVRKDGRSMAAASLAWQAFCVYPTPGAAKDFAGFFIQSALSRGR